MRMPDFLDARVVPPDPVAELGMPAWPSDTDSRHAAVHDVLVLVCDENGLHLELREGRRRTVLTVDFLAGVLQHRAKINQARSEMLVRACGVPKDGSPWRVIDATAGLGRDAFLLATCGARVTMLERHPVLVLLLENALRELAGHSPESLPGHVEDHSPAALPTSPTDVAARMHLVEGDAISYLKFIAANEPERPQVVYCDPMFPPRTKSAAVSGEMQVLHALIGETPDADAMFTAALRAATRRVVVKRPLRAEPLRAGDGLAHIHPSYALEGRASRFDVYLVETLPLKT